MPLTVQDVVDISAASGLNWRISDLKYYRCGDHPPHGVEQDSFQLIFNWISDDDTRVALVRNRRELCWSDSLGARVSYAIGRDGIAALLTAADELTDRVVVLSVRDSVLCDYQWTRHLALSQDRFAPPSQASLNFSGNGRWFVVTRAVQVPAGVPWEERITVFDLQDGGQWETGFSGVAHSYVESCCDNEIRFSVQPLSDDGTMSWYLEHPGEWPPSGRWRVLDLATRELRAE